MFALKPQRSRFSNQLAFSVNRRNFGRQRIYPLSHNDLGELSENEGLMRV
jgi:hypothetical protein